MTSTEAFKHQLMHNTTIRGTPRDPLYREPHHPQSGRQPARLLLLVGVISVVAISGTVLGSGFGVRASSTPVTFDAMAVQYAPHPEVVNTPTPTPAPPVEPVADSGLSNNTPESTVRLFYSYLDQQRYADLRAIAIGPAYAALPDPTSLSGRTPAGSLTVERAEVATTDGSDNTAVVDVDVVEQIAPGPQGARHYTGAWTLVRGPSGWLLSDSALSMQ